MTFDDDETEDDMLHLDLDDDDDGDWDEEDDDPEEEESKDESFKTVRVAGQVTVGWIVELPEKNKHNGSLCDDPAKEAVLEAIPQQQAYVYLWGRDAEPVRVYLEVHEEDIEVEEDGR